MNNDGGPAFPVPGNPATQPGMTLRDYFAGQAMQAMVGSYRITMRGKENAQWDHEGDVTQPQRDLLLDRNAVTGEFEGAAEISTDAYAIADAMLATRQAQPVAGESS